MSTTDAGPVPMHIPAILQNPANKTQRQVEAFNVQQRERAAARRERDAARAEEPVASKRGKRVVRRMNNATFVDNPHVVHPKRGDMAPAVPLHHHPLRPAFPPDALERKVPIPPADAQRADPLGTSSVHGAFSTSLKGTRAMLRRRGRRAEVFVPVVENEVRAWLGGDFELTAGTDDSQWRVVDAETVPWAAAETANGTSPTAGPSRRMPQQHQVITVPALPVSDGRVPAVLELSRSAAHLTWAVPESFDRLVVHLVARYYDLVSWSEDSRTASGEAVRLTHIVRPNIVRARAPPASHALLTPETSDASGVSGSDTEHGSGTDSDAPTEVAHSDTESVGYDADTSLLPGDADGNVTDADMSVISMPGVDTPTPLSERWADDSADDARADGAATPHASLTERFAELELHRTASHGSSAYASSEGGWTDVGADSVFQAAGAAGPTWEPGSPVMATTLPGMADARTRAPQRLGGSDVLDKPTFFEYLFGE